MFSLLLLPCSGAKSNLSVSNSTAPISFSPPRETLVTPPESKQGRGREPILFFSCARVSVCLRVCVSTLRARLRRKDEGKKREFWFVVRVFLVFKVRHHKKNYSFATRRTISSSLMI